MKKVKKISIFIIICIVAIGLMSISTNASPGSNSFSGKKLLQAKYGVEIIYNNKALTGTEAPFIVNGRTFVPLRMIMDYFGDKTITWNSTNQKVTINDTPNSLETQIAEKNAQILVLQNQIAALKDKIADLEDGGNIRNLEDTLNDDFEDDVEEITLSGDKEHITVTIKMDESKWDDLSSSKKEDILQDICNDIWDEFDDANITGKVKDGSTTLKTFTVSAGHSVSLDIDFDSLTDDIKDNYKSDWTDEGLPFNLNISGDDDNITFKLSLSYTTYRSAWNGLSDSDLGNMMDDIKEAIADEYDDADIVGYVYDSSGRKNLAKYSDSGLTRYY